MADNKELEKMYPHSPELTDRKVMDGGFSDGWGMHFMATDRYWVDVHTHLNIENSDNIIKVIDKQLKTWEFERISRFSVILPILSKEKENVNLDWGEAKSFDELIPAFEAVKDRKDISLQLWLYCKNPDKEVLEKSIALGIRGVKLHNHSLMMDNFGHDIWLSSEWAEVFKVIEKHRLPVLFHVTQRLSDSKYTGGGKNTYWKLGWKKGVTYNNEDLFQTYLKLVERYPGIPFVGAHQLHLGWPRLIECFEKYPNFYIDTSIGCTLRPDDDFYDHDREYLRNIFIKYQDRILFGTDQFITDKRSSFEEIPVEEIRYQVLGHTRFIRKLMLPYDVFEKISHGNAERLYNMEPVPEASGE